MANKCYSQFTDLKLISYIYSTNIYTFFKLQYMMQDNWLIHLCKKSLRYVRFRGLFSAIIRKTSN